MQHPLSADEGSVHEEDYPAEVQHPAETYYSPVEDEYREHGSPGEVQHPLSGDMTTSDTPPHDPCAAFEVDVLTVCPSTDGETSSNGFMPVKGQPLRRRAGGTPALTAKQLANAAARMNWLRIDQLGNISLVSTDKYRVAFKLGVQPRDLRLLDPQMASISPPAILDRPLAIVVNLGSIKCIITLQYVLVVNPQDEVAVQLAEVLKDKLSNPMHVGKVMSYPGLSKISSINRHLPVPTNTQQGPVIGLSFELKVLEICLDMAVDALDGEARELEQLIIPTLEELTRKVKPLELEVMRRGKNRLTRLVKRVETIKEVLEKFLQDDEDMHKLNLTAQELSRQASLMAGGGPTLTTQDVLSGFTPRVSRTGRRSRKPSGSLHGGSGSSSSSSSSSGSSKSSMSLEGELEVAQVEMLLEAYQMHLDHLYNKLQTLEQFVQDTEDLVNTALDTQRNRIIAVDIVLTAFYTALGIANGITAVFAMNVEFHSLLTLDLHTTFIIVTVVGAIVGPMLLLALFMLWARHTRLITF